MTGHFEKGKWVTSSIKTVTFENCNLELDGESMNQDPITVTLEFKHDDEIDVFLYSLINNTSYTGYIPNTITFTRGKAKTLLDRLHELTINEEGIKFQDEYKCPTCYCKCGEHK